jgi:hypothetical protein
VSPPSPSKEIDVVSKNTRLSVVKRSRVGAEHEEALGEAAEPRDDCIQLAGLAQHVDAPEALQDALRPLSRVSSTRTGSIDIFRPSSVTCRRRSSG